MPDAPRRTAAPTTRPAQDKPAEQKPTPRKTCVVPSPKGGCKGAPEWRGLCSAHRHTHRGLAGPAEPKVHADE